MDVSPRSCLSHPHPCHCGWGCFPPHAGACWTSPGRTSAPPAPVGPFPRFHRCRSLSLRLRWRSCFWQGLGALPPRGQRPRLPEELLGNHLESEFPQVLLEPLRPRCCVAPPAARPLRGTCSFGFLMPPALPSPGSAGQGPVQRPRPGFAPSLRRLSLPACRCSGVTTGASGKSWSAADAGVRLPSCRRCCSSSSPAPLGLASCRGTAARWQQRPNRGEEEAEAPESLSAVAAAALGFPESPSVSPIDHSWDVRWRADGNTGLLIFTSLLKIEKGGANTLKNLALKHRFLSGRSPTWVCFKGNTIYACVFSTRARVTPNGIYFTGEAVC